MRAAVIVNPGSDARLSVCEVPAPLPGPKDLLIRVGYAGVNRGDTGQLRGRYPAPAGAPPYPGLECYGHVTAVGADIMGWSVGEPVCALLPGGGYAELVTAAADCAFRPPANLPPEACGALPEIAATVWSNLVLDAGLGRGETVLLHGGASGIGTFAIQVARALGARSVVTASASKLARCRELGADVAIDYRSADLHEQLREAAGSRGFDVILDLLGGATLESNIALLARGGRLVVIGLQQGDEATFSLRGLMAKRARISGSMLRGSPAEEKATILDAVRRDLLPLVASGEVAPVVDTVYSLDSAAKALRRVERSEHVGKVVVEVDSRSDRQ